MRDELRHDAGDPLTAVLPLPADRREWVCAGRSTATDTGEQVFHYRHQRIGRALLLDADCRVYGCDAEGVVRLFGRGGALALAVALNVVFDGADRHRPSRVDLPHDRARVATG